MGAPTKAEYAAAERDAARAKTALDRLTSQLRQTEITHGETSNQYKRLSRDYMELQSLLIGQQRWLATWKGKAI
jgi:hypothetical protein